MVPPEGFGKLLHFGKIPKTIGQNLAEKNQKFLTRKKKILSREKFQKIIELKKSSKNTIISDEQFENGAKYVYSIFVIVIFSSQLRFA